MKRFFLIIAALVILHNSNAQVKIGAPGIPDANAVLELASTSKGLLLPRLALTGTTNPAPLSAFTPGMVIYNTALISDVRPGYYFSDGTKWLRIVTSTDGWLLGGNTGTNRLFDYVGTTDSMGLTLRTFNTDRINISATGSVGIGVSAPSASKRLTIDGTASGHLAANLGLIGQLNATADGQTLCSIYNVPIFGNAFNPNYVIGNYSRVSYSNQAGFVLGTYSEAFTAGANSYPGIVAGIQGSAVRTSTGNDGEYYGGYFTADASNPGSGQVLQLYSIRTSSTVSGSSSTSAINFGGLNNTVTLSNNFAFVNTMVGIKNFLNNQSATTVSSAFGMWNAIIGFSGSQYNNVYGSYTDISANPGSSMLNVYGHFQNSIASTAPINNYTGIYVGNIGLNSGLRRAFEYAGVGSNDPVIINFDGSVQIGTTTPVQNAKLTIVDGHLQSGQTTKPTITATSNMGIGATATLNDATDIAGIINLDFGTGAWVSGVQATIVFNKSYANTPIIILTPANSAAATAVATQLPFVTANNIGFIVNFGNAATNGNLMLFNYHVIETVNN